MLNHYYSKTTDFKPLFPTMSIKASSSSQKPNKTGPNQITKSNLKSAMYPARTSLLINMTGKFRPPIIIRHKAWTSLPKWLQSQCFSLTFFSIIKLFCLFAISFLNSSVAVFPFHDGHYRMYGVAQKLLTGEASLYVSYVVRSHHSHLLHFFFFSSSDGFFYFWYTQFLNCSLFKQSTVSLYFM